MSFPKYPKYKDSGVEWLGDVPEHWDVSRLGFECDTLVPMRDKPEQLDGHIPWIRIEDFDGKFISSSKSGQGISSKTVTKMNLKVMPVGTVLCSCSCSMGKTAIVATPLVTNQTFIGIVPKQTFTPDYLYFLFHAAAEHLNSIGTGAIQSYLSRDDFRRLRLPCPPREEQALLTEFLDRETSKIDALIAEQRRLIELLKEKRQAVISHAVTKGLNPNAPMKPSGIEWLGDVPLDWEVTRLKHLVIADRGIQMGPFGGMLKELEVSPTPFKLYGQQNTINDDFEVGSRWLSEDRFMALREYELLPNDVVLTRKGASIGHCRLVPEHIQQGVIDSDTIRVRLNFDQLTVAFAVLLMHEGYLEIEIMHKQKGSVLPGLNTGTIANLCIALPKIDEQNEICKHTEYFGGQILSLIAEATRAIDLLQERRTALISAAVTGKIDVREFAHVETV